MNKLIFALIASVAVAGAAQAQTTTTAPRGYVGVGVATANNSTIDSYKSSAKVFGGYDFDQNLGIEAGYTDFRNADYNVGGVRGTTKGSGTYVAGKYTVPVNEQVSAYGKLGLAYSERKLSDSTGLNVSNHDTGAYAGLGLQYKLNQNVSLNAEYERYGKSKDFGAKADVWTVGAKYAF
jgi:OOP family OmpA-OmpF porin